MGFVSDYKFKQLIPTRLNIKTQLIFAARPLSLDQGVCSMISPLTKHRGCDRRRVLWRLHVPLHLKPLGPPSKWRITLSAAHSSSVRYFYGFGRAVLSSYLRIPVVRHVLLLPNTDSVVGTHLI